MKLRIYITILATVLCFGVTAQTTNWKAMPYDSTRFYGVVQTDGDLRVKTTQVIGGTFKSTNAALDIQSTNKGVLVPRLTTAQMLAISAGSEKGLLVYNTDSLFFYYRDGGTWYALKSGSTSSTPTWQQTINATGGNNLTQANSLNGGGYKQQFQSGQYYFRTGSDGHLGVIELDTNLINLKIDSQMFGMVLSKAAELAYIGELNQSFGLGFWRTPKLFAFDGGKIRYSAAPTAADSTGIGYVYVAKNDTIYKMGINTLLGYAPSGGGGSGGYSDSTNCLVMNATSGNIYAPCLSSGASIRNDVTLDNIAIGRATMVANDSCGFNTAIGAGALENIRGDFNGLNVAIGNGAARNLTPLDDGFTITNAIGNVAIGYQAMYNTINASGNVAIGNGALFGNLYFGGDGLPYTGDWNVGIGQFAGHKISNGRRNILIGAYTCNFDSPDSGLVGSSNIIIGSQATVKYTDINHSIAIGDSCIAESSNQLAFSDSITHIKMNGLGGTTGQVLGVDANGYWVPINAGGGGGGDSSCCTNFDENVTNVVNGLLETYLDDGILASPDGPAASIQYRETKEDGSGGRLLGNGGFSYMVQSGGYEGDTILFSSTGTTSPAATENDTLIIYQKDTTVYLKSNRAIVINEGLTVYPNGGVQFYNADSATIYAISSPQTGTTFFCTDCTANDGSTGVKVCYNGALWKREW